MNFKHKTSLVGLILCAVSLPLGGGVFHKTDYNDQSKAAIQTELEYYKQAAVLNDLLFKEGVPVHMNVVISMLKEIDKNIVKFYPDGPFTRTDFIALGWLESEFKQYEPGTHGERGIFQIMPDEFQDFDVHKNYYNVNVNTLMAFRVLQSKYKKYPDYKTAIMAYNGLIRFKSGNYSQKYWNNFEKRKIAIELALVLAN